jgi:hypothetical protein
MADDSQSVESLIESAYNDIVWSRLETDPGTVGTLVQSQPSLLNTFFIPVGGSIPPQLKQFNPK